MGSARHGTFGLITAAALVAAVGCGSTAPAAAPPVAGPPPGPAATSTPTPAATPAPAAAAPRGLSETELRGALLALDELPSGFAVETDDAGEGDEPLSSRSPECDALVRLLNEAEPSGTTAAADIAFDGGSSGPLLTEDLAQLASPQAAADYVRVIGAAVSDCDTVTLDLGDGDRVAMSVDKVSAPELGDSRTAIRFTSDDPDIELEVDQIVVATGSVVLLTTGFAALPEDVEGFTEQAFDKLTERTGGGTGGSGTSSRTA